MAEFNIFRPLTKDELSEMTPLNSTDVLNLFLKKMSDKMAEYHKRFRPYDDYSARIDFDIVMKTKMVEAQAMVDADKKVDVEFGDLDEYGNPDRFVFSYKKDVFEDKLLDGIRQPIKVGCRYHFKANKRGNKVSILVPCILDDKNVTKMDTWVAEQYEPATEPEEELEAEEVAEAETLAKEAKATGAEDTVEEKVTKKTKA